MNGKTDESLFYPSVPAKPDFILPNESKYSAQNTIFAST